MQKEGEAWDGSKIMSRTEPLPLPRELAPEGKAERGAAPSEWHYD